jgi:phosphohistidine swiveling domain-containing protein
MIKIVDAPAELADARLVGHKFARQQRLRDAGVSVPPFFCVVIESPWTAIADVVAPFPGVDAGAERLTTWAETARTTAESIYLTMELQTAVLEKCVGLSLRDVAVRACVVGRNGHPGEDDAADPFAGLTDSYLYVDAGELIDRISACAASVFSVKSVLYRAQRGIDPSILGVCVGIQQMIDGRRSFVAFTHDPVTGARGTTVAAVYGIGEGAVAERADIDHFFVQPGGIERRISHKQRMLCRAPTGGVAEYRVPDDLADEPALSDAQIEQIAQLAETAERLFSGPQDIEGVVTADSTIHLVQARPAVRSRTVGPSVEWTNHNLTESFPGVSTAMTYSHARTFYRMSFRDFYRTVGVPESQLRSREHHLRRMVGYLDGRLYYRLDAWYALHSQIPGWDILRPLWERSLELQAHNPVLHLALDRRAVVRLLARSPRLIWAAASFPRQLQNFLAWWDDQHLAGMELSHLPADDIVAVYRRVWSEAERHWGVTILAGYLGLAVYAAATLLVQRWTEIAEVNLAALLPGGTPNRTLESVHSTVALAEQMNAIPELSRRVLTADPGETWDEIERGGYGSKLAADAITHLRRFGDRAMNDLKIEEPTPRQRPEMLIESLRPFVAAGATMQHTSLQEATAARGALDELQRICPSRSRRAILYVALRAGRFLAKAREDTRFCRTQLYGFSREAMSRLGADLAAAGWLDLPDDYVHLEAEELLGAFDGTCTHVDLRHLARARKDAYLQSCRRPALTPRFTTAALPIEFADLRRSAANAPALGDCTTVLAGLPSSAGIARAQAKLVLRPDVRPDDCAGRILVARETDPGWLPLMLNAAGLVAERGSMLSHTAITGRMLGVPTIVAVPGATTAITDGDDIEIDGRSGTVRIFHRHRQKPR